MDNLTNYLEELPKELWEIIMSYVKSYDIDNLLSVLNMNLKDVLDWKLIFHYEFYMWEPANDSGYDLYKKWLIMSEGWQEECYQMMLLQKSKNQGSGTAKLNAT